MNPTGNPLFRPAVVLGSSAAPAASAQPAATPAQSPLSQLVTVNPFNTTTQQGAMPQVRAQSQQATQARSLFLQADQGQALNARQLLDSMLPVMSTMIDVLASLYDSSQNNQGRLNQQTQQQNQNNQQQNANPQSTTTPAADQSQGGTYGATPQTRTAVPAQTQQTAVTQASQERQQVQQQATQAARQLSLANPAQMLGTFVTLMSAMLQMVLSFFNVRGNGQLQTSRETDRNRTQTTAPGEEAIAEDGGLLTLTPSTPQVQTPPQPQSPMAQAQVQAVMVEPVGPHNAQVLDVLDDGLAPEQIQTLLTELPATVNAPQSLAELQQFAVNDYLQSYQVANGSLQQLLALNNPAQRVVNLSFGRTAMTTLNSVKDALNATPALRAQFMAQSGLPANASLDDPNVNLAIANFVTTVLGNSPEVNQSLASYRQLTQAAASRGIVIAVAAGNDQALFNRLRGQGINIDPTWALNNLALSSSVIPVGAIDDRDTPGFADDTLTAFGSLAGQNFGPIIAADAVNVNGNNGTSFSTPQVTDLVVKMLQVNPRLSFGQVRQLLISTASYQVGGLPVIDPNRALAAAAQAA